MSGIRLQLKHDSAASWASHNTVLRSGEVGYDTTNAKFVFGDGVTAWNSWTEDDFFTKATTSPGVWGLITGTLSSSDRSAGSFGCKGRSVRNDFRARHEGR
jgi:hypothetical protein